MASAQSIQVAPSAGMPANFAATCSLQSLLAHKPPTTDPTTFSDLLLEDQTAPTSTTPLSSPLQVPETTGPGSSTGLGIKLTLKLPRPVTVPFTTDIPVLSEMPCENDKENAPPATNLPVLNGKKGKQPKLDPKDRPAVANNTNGVR